MVQCVRALAAPADDSNSILRTAQWLTASTTPVSVSPLLPSSWEHQAHMWYKDMCAGKTLITQNHE